MTKLKCSNCEEIEDLINMTCECSDCYMKGAVKEQLRERERIKELIDECVGYSDYKKNMIVIDKEELKARIEGEK